LGLEEWIKQQEPQTIQQETPTSEMTQPEPVVAEPSAKLELALPTPTCWNCINLLENCCVLDDTLIIENPRKTSCESFQRKKCLDCEDYQDGLCCFNDDSKKPKSPVDACEYDRGNFFKYYKMLRKEKHEYRN